MVKALKESGSQLRGEESLCPVRAIGTYLQRTELVPDRLEPCFSRSETGEDHYKRILFLSSSEKPSQRPTLQQVGLVHMMSQALKLLWLFGRTNPPPKYWI